MRSLWRLYVRSVCRLSSRVAEIFLFILSALSHMPAVPTDSLPLQCVPSTLSVALSLCQCVPRNSLPLLLPVVMRIRRQSSAGAPSRRYHPAYSYRPRCASSSGYPPRGSAGSPRHSSRRSASPSAYRSRCSPTCTATRRTSPPRCWAALSPSGPGLSRCPPPRLWRAAHERSTRPASSAASPHPRGCHEDARRRGRRR